MEDTNRNHQASCNKAPRLHTLLVTPVLREAEEIAAYLARKGDEVVAIAGNSKEAREMFDTYLTTIDIVIIDLSLEDGVELYRSFPKEVPVIYLNKVTDEQSIDKAVMTEPLCYLIKPINYDEVGVALHFARYKLLRQNSKQEHSFALGRGFEFDHIRNILTRGTKRWHLGGKKSQLLKMLINANGKYVPFDILEQALYPESPPGDSSLRTMIYRLRQLFDKGMIETRRNYGVRLVFG